MPTGVAQVAGADTGRHCVGGLGLVLCLGIRLLSRAVLDFAVLE
jgi:hypothetical protein